MYTSQEWIIPKKELFGMFKYFRYKIRGRGNPFILKQN